VSPFHAEVIEATRAPESGARQDSTRAREREKLAQGA
jgi:hypothetical protein